LGIWVGRVILNVPWRCGGGFASAVCLENSLGAFAAVSVGVDGSPKSVSDPTAGSFDPDILSALLPKNPTARAPAMARTMMAGMIATRDLRLAEVVTAGLVSSSVAAAVATGLFEVRSV